MGEQPDSAGMTPEELSEAKRYGRLELICTLADKAIDVAYLAVAAFVLARPVDAWLSGFSLPGRNATLRLLLLFVLFTAGHMAVSFPMSFYSGHVLEHQFSLSRRHLPAGCGDMPSAICWAWHWAPFL